MTISIIVAMSENRVIGRNGKVPWYLPEDLERFKEITMGHALIMGRKTYESIGKLLPGRRTIVLSRQVDYRPVGCETASSLQQAIDNVDNDDIFICGGSAVYAAALPLTTNIYLTFLHAVVDGDTFFPIIPADFIEFSRESRAEGETSYDFIVLKRKSSSDGL